MPNSFGGSNCFVSGHGLSRAESGSRFTRDECPIIAVRRGGFLRLGRENMNSTIGVANERTTAQ